MKLAIVKIGNSKGIRIPRPILKQCDLQTEVEAEVREQTLVIRSAHHPRKGWDEAFKLMHTHGEDQLLDKQTPFSSNWDKESWEWK